MVFAHKKKKRRVSGARPPTKPATPIESRSPESASGAVLLTPQQLAVRLAVPVSWIREKTRERARVRDADPLPVVRLGKYCRFSWAVVEQWLQRQSDARSEGQQAAS